MRLIKKEEQSISRFAQISFAGETAAAVADPPAPHWLEAARAAAGSGGAASRQDPDQIEKKAFEAGFRQGEKAGMDLAEKKVEAVMKRYTDAILEIAGLKPRLYAQVEREVVRLALEVARKIVHREVQVDQEIVQTLIRVALSHVTAKTPVTVRLHPFDYNFMMEQRKAAAQDGERDRDLLLISDRSVERGGCLIETECGEVDARITEEFHEVQRAFFNDPE